MSLRKVCFNIYWLQSKMKPNQIDDNGIPISQKMNARMIWYFVLYMLLIIKIECRYQRERRSEKCGRSFVCTKCVCLCFCVCVVVMMMLSSFNQFKIKIHSLHIETKHINPSFSLIKWTDSNLNDFILIGSSKSMHYFSHSQNG